VERLLRDIITIQNHNSKSRIKDNNFRKCFINKCLVIIKKYIIKNTALQMLIINLNI
jgi:hypothetical protein